MISVSVSLVMFCLHIFLVLIFHPFVILSEDCYCSQLSPQVHIGSEEWRVERVTSLESAQSLSKCVLMRIAAYVRRPRI